MPPGLSAAQTHLSPVLPFMRNINPCKWPQKCQLWLPRSSTNKPDLFPALQLLADLLSSCFQKGGTKEAREKRNNQSQGPSNTNEPGYQGWSFCSSVQMRVMLREVQKALTHPGFWHNKSVFPGNAWKAAEFVLMNTLTPVSRPLPQLASGSHSSSCLQKQMGRIRLSWKTDSSPVTLNTSSADNFPAVLGAQIISQELHGVRKQWDLYPAVNM